MAIETVDTNFLQQQLELLEIVDISPILAVIAEIAESQCFIDDKVRTIADMIRPFINYRMSETHFAIIRSICRNSISQKIHQPVAVNDIPAKMSCDWLTSASDTIMLALTVKPNSSVTRICTLSEQVLEISITAPPRDGEANAAICDFISSTLNVPKSRVTVFRGHKSKQKVLSILASDLTQDMVLSKITQANCI